MALLAVACDPFHTGFADVEPAVVYRAMRPVAAEPPDGSLVVMTWNVKFGAGRVNFFFDCHGERGFMKRAEVHGNLDGLAAKVRQTDPDVLLLNEVDVGSRRSAYVDQLQYLLDHTELSHAVYASVWKADFVPSDGLGRMDMGNAILSRWPVADGMRLSLPAISEQDGLTQYFYLHRNVLRARVDLPGEPDLHVVNVHTAAFSNDGTKRKHLDRFADELAALETAGAAFVGGGDLNTLPPGSDKLRDFPDSACDERFEADDYSEEGDWLAGLYADWAPGIPLAEYQADNAGHHTHTTDGDGFWNRKLDYLFTNGRWLPGSGTTHQDEASGGMATMPLSDHAPVSARLEWPR